MELAKESTDAFVEILSGPYVSSAAKTSCLYTRKTSHSSGAWRALRQHGRAPNSRVLADALNTVRAMAVWGTMMVYGRTGLGAA